MQAPKKNEPAGAISPPSAKRPLWPKLLTVVVLLGVAVTFIWLLPKGFSQDFSLIGKGNSIVVMVHSPQQVDSANNMSAVSLSLRDEYKGRVTFLVADLFTAQGMEFIKAHGIENTTALVFFAPNGEKIKVLYGQQSVESLRKNIDNAFHF